MGFYKTMSALLQRVWWPKMDTFVRAYVSSCPTCQKVKDRTTAKPGLLQPLPIPEERFANYSMDFIFGLPVSNGFTGVMTIVDRLTKMVRLHPCTETITA